MNPIEHAIQFLSNNYHLSSPGAAAEAREIMNKLEKFLSKSVTFFKISDGWGHVGDSNQNYSFKVEKEAVDAATEFKTNPRSHNPRMTDDNVKYWSEKTYTVEKHTITVEPICNI